MGFEPDGELLNRIETCKPKSSPKVESEEKTGVKKTKAPTKKETPKVEIPADVSAEYTGDLLNKGFTVARPETPVKIAESRVKKPEVEPEPPTPQVEEKEVEPENS